MVCFQTKNSYVGKFWRVLEWKCLIYSMTIWNILRPFCAVYGHLVILLQFGIFSPVLVYCVMKNLATFDVGFRALFAEMKRLKLKYSNLSIYRKNQIKTESFHGRLFSDKTSKNVGRTNKQLITRLIFYCNTSDLSVCVSYFLAVRPEMFSKTTKMSLK
jgi:hypothetical protein